MHPHPSAPFPHHMCRAQSIAVPPSPLVPSLPPSRLCATYPPFPTCPPSLPPLHVRVLAERACVNRARSSAAHARVWLHTVRFGRPRYRAPCRSQAKQPRESPRTLLHPSLCPLCARQPGCTATCISRPHNAQKLRPHGEPCVRARSNIFPRARIGRTHTHICPPPLPSLPSVTSHFSVSAFMCPRSRACIYRTTLNATRTPARL